MRFILAAFLSVFCTQAFANQACKAQVDAAFAKLREAKSFKLETTITNAEGTLIMEADYVLPDRMHQKVQLGKDSTAMEMIVVGEKAWSNQGAGWAELPKIFADKVVSQIKETVAEAPKAVTDYTCLGDKTFEGKTYAVYQGLLAPPMPTDPKMKGPRKEAATASNQQSVYVDKETGLPARNIVTPVSDPEKRLFDGKFTVVRDMSIEPPKIN